MTQPFMWYGGKFNMLQHLLPLIPPHVQYLEVFSGAASLFWRKSPSKNEVLNDLNSGVVNFYRVAKHPEKFKELQILIQGTLHSEIDYLKSREMLKEFKASDVELAWALWCQSQLTFSHLQYGGFAFGSTGMGLGTANKRDNFVEWYCLRLKNTEIFCRDAVELIELKATSSDTLVFADPPYYNSDCGNYKGYTDADFIKLLNCLANTKAKFILTSYPSTHLTEFREKYGWGSKNIKQIVSVTGKREETKYKTECITYNFIPPNNQPDLFADQENNIEP